MPLYIFYPSRADGTSETFICLELQDDKEANLRAMHLLGQHPGSMRIAVWTGERRISSQTRLPALLG